MALSNDDAAKLRTIRCRGVKFNIKPVTEEGNAGSLMRMQLTTDQARHGISSRVLMVRRRWMSATVTEANGYVFGTSIVKSRLMPAVSAGFDNGTGDVPTLPHGLYLVTETDAMQGDR
jgi:hypothetical protein